MNRSTQKESSMQTKSVRSICLYCAHFRNTPAFLESIFKGLTSLSSAHGSVRKDDGICLKNDLYLSAYDWCDRFRASTDS